jgi:pyridoxamine 5'-phosphate oxidase
MTAAGEGVDIAALRRMLRSQPLSEEDLDPEPTRQFARWLDDAMAAKVDEPTAMVLATAGPDGAPSARNVLLKGVDRRGFVFYTNRESRKGRQLAANPRAALTFAWIPLQRQVLVTGTVGVVADAEADAYFAGRPRGSQLGAWASPQSSVIGSRAVLEDSYRAASARFGPGPVPRPGFWGGYRVVPLTVELWHGRPDRLHDRLRYRRDAPARPWVIERLAP